jgi:hypothetical protein
MESSAPMGISDSINYYTRGEEGSSAIMVILPQIPPEWGHLFLYQTDEALGVE